LETFGKTLGQEKLEILEVIILTWLSPNIAKMIISELSQINSQIGFHGSDIKVTMKIKETTLLIMCRGKG
jgi:hypothetical protein